MTEITVFQARKCLTMNAAQPRATHIAVRDGRILLVGDAADMRALGAYHLDRRFAKHVLMPGLVEGHAHLMAGGLWKFPYVGFHARMAPNGALWAGCATLEDVVLRLIAIERQLPDDGRALLAWGFDPIFFGSARMTCAHLDRVSASRPVILWHASQHLMNVNSLALGQAGFDQQTELEGLGRDARGALTGELQEFAAMFPIMRLLGDTLRQVGMSEDSVQMFGQLAQWAGVTTATDMVNDLSAEPVAMLDRLTRAPHYPVRLIPAFLSLDGALDVNAGIARVIERRALSHAKLTFGMVKLIVDGSIQGFTARLRWPGYFNGRPNGIWVLPPSALKAAIAQFHAAGLQIHLHTNGDEATALALDGIEEALNAHPRLNHRHTLQHCQLADRAQFQRMKRLGVCVNLFANHLYYWGDAHRTHTLGPDRAERMNACATALAEGVPLAIHSDAPITPLAPLFTAWCAVNRLTSSGVRLGSAEQISVAQALYAITLGAAFTLHMDHLIGSLEVGKYADFCVLSDDPLAIDPLALKDIEVLGTVLGGRVMERPERPRPAAQP